jgi:hypothetical protein
MTWIEGRSRSCERHTGLEINMREQIIIVQLSNKDHIICLINVATNIRQFQANPVVDFRRPIKRHNFVSIVIDCRLDRTFNSKLPIYQAPINGNTFSLHIQDQLMSQRLPQNVNIQEQSTRFAIHNFVFSPSYKHHLEALLETRSAKRKKKS